MVLYSVHKYDAQSSPVVLFLIPQSKATSRIYHYMLLFNSFLLFVSWQIALDVQNRMKEVNKATQKVDEMEFAYAFP